MAKVSIIIPVYNVERYLRECLDSVCNQTLKDLEIICIDDGSTDSSGLILEEYARKDQRFHIVHKSNEGYGKAMNIGMSLATAPYIGIVESDDFVEIDMYEILSQIMEEKKVEAIKADFFEFYNGEEGYIKEKISVIPDTRHREMYETVFNIQNYEEAFRFYKYTWSGLYDREFLKREGIIHNETPGASFQDQSFWFQTIMKAKSLYFVKQPFYHYRIDNLGSSMYSKEKVFTMFGEYEFIQSVVKQMEGEGKRFARWTCYMKITTNINHISRVAAEYKMDLAERIRKEFLVSMELGVVDPELYAPIWKEKIFDILSRPQYYVEKERTRQEKIESAVNKYNVVILYGAGKIGREMQRRLKEQRINTKVKYFAVTDMEGNPDTICGIPVRTIDKLQKYKETALIIISVGKSYVSQVEKILNIRGFKNSILFKDII